MALILVGMISAAVASEEVEYTRVERLSDNDLKTLCTAKYYLIEWTLKNTPTYSTGDLIAMWKKRYIHLHLIDSNIFQSETEIDMERIIRDVRRLGVNNHDVSNKTKDFMVQESRWCGFYEH